MDMQQARTRNSLKEKLMLGTLYMIQKQNIASTQL
jgi:hypothetical protein